MDKSQDLEKMKPVASIPPSGPGTTAPTAAGSTRWPTLVFTMTVIRTWPAFPSESPKDRLFGLDPLMRAKIEGNSTPG